MNHFLPVFTIDGEAGWLLLTPKGDPKRTKALRSVTRDDRIAPERTVKAWWVSHGLEGNVAEALGGEWCHDCARGAPCAAWDHDALSLQDFEPRAPEITEREVWDTFVEDTLRDFYANGVEAFRSKAHDAVGAVPGSTKARVIDGVFDSMGAAGTVFAQFFEAFRESPPPAAAAANPATMSVARAREVLSVGVDATPEQIKRAFVRASMVAHPDKGGSDARMQEVIEARKVLS